VLPPERIPSLIGGGGQLHRRPDAALAAAAFGEVLAEARAQLARFRERVGREPTHVDAHHHCHRVGVVLEAVVEQAREAGLPVRATSEEQRLRFRSEGLRTCDAFIDGFYDADANLETLLRLLGSLGEGTTELMCHPAEVDDELRESSGYAEPRAAELAALTSPEVRAALEAAGVELIHFGRL
jgi:predicted glycoside hydrolase/deacetylase ChbG (UPF0249 family)